MKRKLVKGIVDMRVERSCGGGYVLIISVPIWDGAKPLPADQDCPREGNEVEIAITKEADDDTRTAP